MSELNNTTSISELPTDPTTGGSMGGNINLNINDSISSQSGMGPIQGPNNGPNQGYNSQVPLDPNTISQLINQLQQAHSKGATSLPSRDIPLNTEGLTNDAQIVPNYIPQPKMTDYINDDDEKYYNNEATEGPSSSLDSIYDELQVPLLLAILYFLFQLPFFKKNIFKLFPFLCHNDGNYNFQGLIFICGLFGFIYYSLSKSVKYLGRVGGT